ncbi:MAG TPA: hypothetical protein VIR63_00935 [Pontiella sp.]
MKKQLSPHLSLLSTFILNAILLVSVLLMGLSLQRKENRIQETVSERKALVKKTAEIDAQVSKIAGEIQGVFDLLGEWVVPEHGKLEWCVGKMSELSSLGGVRLSTSVEGEMVPYGMDVNWDVRRIKDFVYPSLVPYLIKVEFNASREGITYLLNSVKKVVPTAIVSHVSVQSSLKAEDPDADEFACVLSIAIPCYLYGKDFELINALLSESH